MPASLRLATVIVALAYANSTAAASTAVAARPIARATVISGLPASWHARAQRRPRTPPGPPRARVRISAARRFQALSGGWQRVAAPFPLSSAGHAMLMTDGVVYIQSPNSSLWYSLVPDGTGNYVKGIWKPQAPLPAGYAPMYYASAILPDGRMIVAGGEYNGTGTGVDTTRAAIYDLVHNKWTPVAPPPGWSTIGDAPSVVLPNGTFMIGNCCTNQQALLNATTLTWSLSGANKGDSNNEEGWTLLPSGRVLTADAEAEPYSELYDPANGIWVGAGVLPANLIQAGEIGPQILRQNGHVFVAGADADTAIYNPTAGSWSAGPTFPVINGQQVDIADGPAVLLPNGDVLMVASPGVYNSPSYFLTFPASGGTTFNQIVGPPNAVNDSSYVYNFLMLPTGQVLETDFSNDVEIYTPPGSANTAVAPVITSVPTTLVHGSTYTAAGKLFTGISQTVAYGDDSQAATNYPLVYIVNGTTGVVTFAFTHSFSSMAVASPAVETTQFDVPSWTPTGRSELVVVTNGIRSAPVAVTIR